MTTGWLLLLVLLVSSHSVDSQSTTDDETCSDGGVLRKLQEDMEKLMGSLKQILQQHQIILDNQQRLYQRLGKLQ